MTDDIGRSVEKIRIRWGANRSRKYDGKVEDIPAEWVVGSEKLGIGKTVDVKVGGGCTWTGVIVEFSHHKNLLELALPVKRTRPVSKHSTQCQLLSTAFQSTHTCGCEC